MADAQSFNDEVAEKGNDRHYNSHMREDVYTLEPDMLDTAGDRYYRYEEYMEATESVTDSNVIAHDINVFIQTV